eukprot:snap_masked-scaffold_61-processed-gene-0.32-mRNA-1 protein AED:1.00 eAED:1.00 QI:0/-1/0/0/-1/1/1/0/64
MRESAVDISVDELELSLMGMKFFFAKKDLDEVKRKVNGMVRSDSASIWQEVEVLVVAEEWWRGD